LMDLFYRLGLNIVITRQDRVNGNSLKHDNITYFHLKHSNTLLL
jgi:hypothetical protein